MAPEGIKRRLTVILSADVVEYSRLMAADDAGTFAQLKTLRKELIEPKTAEYNGRVIKLMGDVLDVEHLIETVDEELVMTADALREDFVVAVYQGRSLGTYTDEDFDGESESPEEGGNGLERDE